MQAEELRRTIARIPPVTRFFTICSVLVCGLVGLNMLEPSLIMCLMYHFELPFQHIILAWKYGKSWTAVGYAVVKFLLQGYRCFTAFMLPAGVINQSAVLTVLDLYFFYNFATHVESAQGKFKGNFPDCLWFTLLLGTIIVLTSFSLETMYTFLPMHHVMMFSCITYIWLRWAKNSTVNFFGLVPIKAYYMPWFEVFFRMLGGKLAVLNSLIGIFGGYIYLCIQLQTMPLYNLLPLSYGQRSQAAAQRVGSTSGELFPTISDSIYDKGYLKAPRFLYKWLNYPMGGSVRRTAFYQPPATRRGYEPAKPRTELYTSYSLGFQGKGHRLGGD